MNADGSESVMVGDGKYHCLYQLLNLFVQSSYVAVILSWFLIDLHGLYTGVVSVLALAGEQMSCNCDALTPEEGCQELSSCLCLHQLDL